MRRRRISVRLAAGGLAATAYALLLLAPADTAGDEPASPPTGSFTKTLAASDLIGDAVPQLQRVFSPDEDISWDVYVPPSYRPEAPAGLFVYISPTRRGALPASWRRVLDKHNLIWIGANQSGNRTRVPRRVLLSLLAVDAAQQDYVLDDTRIYIGGFSGGGRVASMVSTDHAETFTGGLFICGAEFWSVDSPRHIDNIRKNRYVFLTGDFDQALAPTKRAFRGYRKAGVERIKLMIIRKMGHSTPRAADFSKAIRFLDAPDDPD